MQITPSPAAVRKYLLIFFGVLICCYAIRVLWHVQAMTDIGLRCAFTTEINQVFEDYQVTRPVILAASASEPEMGRGQGVAPIDAPRQGDRILQLGTYEVDSWPRYLRSLIDLGGRDAPVVKDLADARANGLAFATCQGDRHVFVEFERDRAGGAPPIRFGSWWRLGHLPTAELVPSILWFFLKLGLFVVGALVFWKRPTDPAASQFFVLCIVTVGAYIGGYNWGRIATDPMLLVPFIVCGVMLPVVSLHFYLIFPRPKAFVRRYPGWTYLTIYGIPSGFLVALVLGYFRVRTLVRGGYPEAAVGEAWWILRNSVLVYLAVAAVWYLASVVSLLHSYRNAGDLTERNQVKWIFFGAVLALVPMGYTLYLVFMRREAFGAGGGTWPMFAASVCFTGAFAVSITRYRLLELDQIINSGAAYFLVSVLASLVYYAVVFLGMLAASLFGGQTIAGASLGQALRVSVTVLILMVLLNVARGGFKRVLDRRFYREKYQLDRTLRRMGQAIEQLVDPPTLARRLLQASADLCGTSQGSVYLREGDPPLYRLVGSLGAVPPPLAELSPGCPLVEHLETRRALTTRAGAASLPAQRQLRLLGGEVAYPLGHEGRLLAFVILGARDGAAYGEEELNLLAAFSQFTTLALESARRHRTIEELNRDLRGKIEKISEQQRRILALQSELTKGAVAVGVAPRTAEAASVSDNGAAGAATATPDPFGAIIGSSPVLRQVLDMARKVAPTPSAVLIRGESGTGKELLAHALHAASPRAGRGRFITVHCAALAPGLLESELFGHVKGGFTSAHRDRVGRFELANDGTLFLDEIGDISPEVQTKLLRVLQEKTFERVGSSEPVKVDVRIIAATHQDLEELIRQGRFRQDLFYRLNVIDLTLPALRERPEDVPELALHFLRKYGDRYGKAVTQLDDDAAAVLKGYAWPGNVRELENVIERAVVIAEGAAITAADLPAELCRTAAALPPAGGWRSADDPAPPPGGGLRAEREEYGRRERERLVRALAAASGNKAEAARALGLARSTLVSRLKKHGLS